MNMRWYLAIFDDAGDILHLRLGVTPEYHRRLPGSRLAGRLACVSWI